MMRQEQARLAELVATTTSPAWPQWRRVAVSLRAKAQAYRQGAAEMATSDSPGIQAWAEPYRMVADQLEQTAREITDGGA